MRDTMKNYLPISSDQNDLLSLNEKIKYAVDQSIELLITDVTGKILYVNKNCCKMNGYTPDELIGKHTSLFNACYHPKKFFTDLWRTILSGNIWKGDLQNKRKDGSLFWIHMSIIPLLDENGRPYQFVALREDITERKEMEFQLVQKDKQLIALTKNSYDVVGIIDRFGIIKYQNQAIERVLGYKPSETLGTNILDYVDKSDHAKGRLLLKQVASHPKTPIRTQYKVKHKDGSLRWYDVVHTNYLGDPYINGIVFNLRDFTEQMEASEKAHQLAYYDYLTGLPNRRLFEKELEQALQKAKTSNRRIALMYLDLDGFKNINDTLGHEVGDILLKKVSRRIENTFEKKAFIGRLGGDEFSLLIPNMYNLKYLHKIASSMIRLFSQPFVIGDIELFVSASVGLSIYPLAGKNMKTLLKNADVAMYQAKKEGKNNFQVYNPSMDENGYKKFLLKNDLKKAINEKHFFIVYQPRVIPTTHEIIGVEALIRWEHPKFGPISPGEFIPYAEETGLIIPLGTWMLKEVCNQVKEWQNQGLKSIKASVNISALQLLKPNFVETILSILEETQLEPQWLELEITETVLLNKEDQAIETLEKLSNLGITIALDDFGTGYSALNYLIKYKFDVIKIDRSILKDIPYDEESYEIANAIVKLAQKLKKTVVAEGIETPCQLALIEQMGCDEFQGFIFSKPVKEFQMKQFLIEGKAHY